MSLCEVWICVCLFETLWDSLQCFETLWDDCFETLRDALRRFKTLWDTETLWDALRRFDTLWYALRLDMHISREKFREKSARVFHCAKSLKSYFLCPSIESWHQNIGRFSPLIWVLASKSTRKTSKFTKKWKGKIFHPPKNFLKIFSPHSTTCLCMYGVQSAKYVESFVENFQGWDLFL